MDLSFISVVPVTYGIFLFFAVIAVASAFLVVSVKSVMHSALFLAVFLLSVAAMFFIFDADFLGIVQILLYIGGVIVLILFAVMLTARVQSHLLQQTNEQKFTALIVCALLFIMLSYLILTSGIQGFEKSVLQGGITRDVGRLLLTVYVLPFEAASLVLLAALIGVMAIAGKKDE
ncbi:MAG: NADH-quinone oxidoreductase subunit J [Candidatus Firestonebacteria bacterium]